MPHKKEEAEHSMIQYWSIRSELAITHGITMNGKKMIIPFLLQRQIQQLHSNHMGIEKTRLLVCEMVYCVDKNTDIETTVLHA